MALALATDRPTILGTIIGAGLCTAVWWLFASKILPSMNQRVKIPSLVNNAPVSKKLPFAPFLLGGFTLTMALLR
jgi:prepilin peptidase CpaA